MRPIERQQLDWGVDWVADWRDHLSVKEEDRWVPRWDCREWDEHNEVKGLTITMNDAKGEQGRSEWEGMLN